MTTFRDGHDRETIRRAWHNTDGQLHRTTGPAVEHWTVLPGGAHVLSHQGWWQNGNNHREGQPAGRRWHVANDGTRVLDVEVWCRHGQDHRVGGPAYRHWVVEPNGTRRLARERWHVNGKLHRVDGPALDGLGFYWHNRQVRQEDLPWLRRGRSFLVALACAAVADQNGDGAATPAWCQDARVRMAEPNTAIASLYKSVVGGAGLLCV